MQLPHNVRRQGEEAERLINEAKEAFIKKKDETPLMPVITAPEKPTEKTESEEYLALQDRFRKYKASTDQTLHELRQSLGKIGNDSTELKDAKDRIKKLEDENKSLAARPVSDDPYVLLDETEREEFTPAFAKAVSKVSASSADKALSIANKKIEELEGKIELLSNHFSDNKKETEQTRKKTFLEQLDTLVPAWEKLQDNVNFQDFMDAIHDLSGLSHQQMINNALYDEDAKRASLIYKKFSKEFNLDINTGNPIKKNLDDLLSPQGNGGEGEVPTIPKDKKIYTRAEIGAFYKKEALGHIRQEEFARMDKEFIQAEREGRVI